MTHRRPSLKTRIIDILALGVPWTAPDLAVRLGSNRGRISIELCQLRDAGLVWADRNTHPQTWRLTVIERHVRRATPPAEPAPPDPSDLEPFPWDDRRDGQFVRAILAEGVRLGLMRGTA